MMRLKLWIRLLLLTLRERPLWGHLRWRLWQKRLSEKLDAEHQKKAEARKPWANDRRARRRAEIGL